LLVSTVLIVTVPGVLFAKRGRAPCEVRVIVAVVLDATFCIQLSNAGVLGRLKLKTASPAFTGAIAGLDGVRGSVIDDEYPVSVVTLNVVDGDPLVSALKTEDGALKDST
jgi:hypothetical protein